MPSKSEKQARVMRAAAHDDEFAKRMGISKEVAKEWAREDAKSLRPKAGKREKRQKYY